MCQETKHVRLAILSDQHFHEPKPDSGAKAHSHILVSTLGQRKGKNPWTDLEDLITENKIKSDMLLCAGDITTHAQDSSLKTAWDCLIRLGTLLESNVVACATGNHDIRSRKNPMPPRASLLREIDRVTGVFEDLKTLTPPYPIKVNTPNDSPTFGRKIRAEYFGNDFALHVHNDIRLVVLNTCAGHTSDPLTYERGIFSEAALEELRLQLNENGGSQPMMNILLCHHHPDVHSDMSSGTYDFVLNGEKLIQTLESYGEWIIIHGHKHNPRIVKAQGASSCPITIFSAGSLGAVLNEGNLGEESRNHFYTLDLSFSLTEGLRGTLSVWAWNAGFGWEESIPCGNTVSSGSGFGEKRNPRTLAHQIAPLVKKSGSLTWSQLVADTDFARHLFPRDVSLILIELDRDHAIAAKSYNKDLVLGPKMP